MTSEELNRAIEFLIQHGAQLDLRLEKLEKLHANDHQVLTQLTLRTERLDKLIEVESHRLRGVETLIEVESKRLARLENEDRDNKEQIRTSHSRHDELMQELRDGLGQIFDKLDRILNKLSMN